MDDAASYRPITLLNTDVKLLARVLVGRMAAGLDLVVDATQADGFHPWQVDWGQRFVTGPVIRFPGLPMASCCAHSAPFKLGSATMEH